MSAFVLSAVPPFLDGVYLGVNAVSDAYLLIDCPSGCFGKCERIGLNHDLTSTLFDPMGKHRIVQSGVDFGQLTMGSEQVLAELVARVVAEVGPRAIVVTQATSALVTSNDVVAFCRAQTEALGVPIVYLPPQTLEGDFLDGFSAFLGALAQASLALGEADPGGARARAGVEAGGAARAFGAPDASSGAPPGAPSGRAADVTLVGYLADRLEEDHRASLSELARLVRGLGLRPAGVLCGGESLERAFAALGAPTLVELPYARAASGAGAVDQVAARTGARVVRAALPLGVGPTVAFVQELAAATGREAQARALLEGELAALVPDLDRARTRFLMDRRVAVAADPHLAAGLLAFLDELGLAVPLVCVQTRREARVAPIRALVGELGVEARVVHDLGPVALRATLEQFGGDGGVDLLVGPSPLRDVATSLGVGFVELGYPSFLVHALYPRPLFGFAGARRLADDLVNALQLHDYARRSSRSRGPKPGEAP